MKSIRLSYAVFSYFALFATALLFLFLASAELLHTAHLTQIVGLFTSLTLGLIAYLRGDLEDRKIVSGKIIRRSISRYGRELVISYFVLFLFAVLTLFGQFLPHQTWLRISPFGWQLVGVLAGSFLAVAAFIRESLSPPKYSSVATGTDKTDPELTPESNQKDKLETQSEDDWKVGTQFFSKGQIESIAATPERLTTFAQWRRFDPLAQPSVISSLFSRTQIRLSKEINALERRSLTNLVTGVMITVIAVGVLVYLVTRPHIDFTTLPAVLSFYIPRITTVALIETFAYFFLRLYKSNLEEIKYYQNERTTITAIEIAWRGSWNPSLSKSGVSILDRIVRMDRNLVTTEDGKRVPNQDELLEMLKVVGKIVVDSSKGKDDDK